VIVGQPAMVTVYCRVPSQPWLSFASIVKVKLPAAVGVPESTPPLERVSPVGKLPLIFAKVYGLLPPLAVKVWLYATPTFPFGSVDGFTVIVGQPGVGVGVGVGVGPGVPPQNSTL